MVNIQSMLEQQIKFKMKISFGIMGCGFKMRIYAGTIKHLT